MDDRSKSWAGKVAAWVGVGSLASLVIVIAGATQVSAFIQANKAALLLWWKIEQVILVIGAIAMCGVMVWNFRLQGTNALKRWRFEKKVREWWNGLPDGAGVFEHRGVRWTLPPAETLLNGQMNIGSPVCPAHRVAIEEWANVVGLKCSVDGAQLSLLSAAQERQSAENTLRASLRMYCEAHQEHR